MNGLTKSVEGWIQNRDISDVCRIWNHTNIKGNHKKLTRGNTLILSILSPSFFDPDTGVGEESHYVTVVFCKTIQGGVKGFVFDSGKGFQGKGVQWNYYTSRISSSKRPPGKHLQKSNTWNVPELDEAIERLKKLANVQSLTVLKTPFPLQLDYQILTGQQSDSMQDTWCQTWSFLYGLFTLVPSYLQDIHRLLNCDKWLTSKAGDQDLNHQQIKEATVILQELVINHTNTDSSFLGSNCEWTVGQYFNSLSHITQLIPCFTGLWLYACIQCLYPHLDTYLETPDVRGESVSQILYAKIDSIKEGILGYTQNGNLIRPTSYTRSIFENTKAKSIPKMSSYFTDYTYINNILPDF
jgi:hypothetical protein